MITDIFKCPAQKLLIHLNPSIANSEYSCRVDKFLFTMGYTGVLTYSRVYNDMHSTTLLLSHSNGHTESQICIQSKTDSNRSFKQKIILKKIPNYRIQTCYSEHAYGDRVDKYLSYVPLILRQDMFDKHEGYGIHI